MKKSKTIAVWLALVLGVFGVHRFYLKGWRDVVAWLLPLPTLLGLWGIRRAQNLGVDDALSWVLIPLLGFTFAACALTAIIYGLREAEVWNAQHHYAPDDAAGQTNWGTVIAIALALLLGAGVLMASIVYSFQHYFQYQIEASRALSQ